ncbi:2'-5' RNA ligase family protein, partial [Staphylococcus equorum]|uniref:2'-5' RNA ligase family protein n=1 Tax=Staphylococcus equorum TaxID=246432 RepID=UPI000ABC2F54
VHAPKASNFAPITTVIYFKVEKTDTLEKLFYKFNNGDFHGVPDHSFVPHFTIAQGLTSQEFEDIYGQLKLAGIDYKETIEQLSLVYYDEKDEKWKVLDNFNLA